MRVRRLKRMEIFVGGENTTETSTDGRWTPQVHWTCAMLQARVERGGLYRAIRWPDTPSHAHDPFGGHYVRNVRGYSVLAGREELSLPTSSSNVTIGTAPVPTGAVDPVPSHTYFLPLFVTDTQLVYVTQTEIPISLTS